MLLAFKLWKGLLKKKCYIVLCFTSNNIGIERGRKREGGEKERGGGRKRGGGERERGGGERERFCNSFLHTNPGQTIGR